MVTDIGIEIGTLVYLHRDAGRLAREWKKGGGKNLQVIEDFSGKGTR